MIKNVKPGGIILLGGKSQRMGTDKYLLPFFNLTLVETLIRELEKVTAEVILITNEPEKLSFLPHKKFKDLYPIPSAMSGLHSGLTHSRYQANFILACDLPLFDSRMIPYFSDHLTIESYAAVPLTPKGYEPLCGLYSKKCLPEIEKMFSENNYAIQELIRRVDTVILPSGNIEKRTHPHVFFNMNTTEDYKEALEHLETINKKS
jgi:molybdopterin-guanine dinucleotide biosynthesis protein A